MNIKLLTLLAGMVLLQYSMAQNFEKDITKAFQLHVDAKSAKAEAKSLEEFEKVMKRHPDEWLAAYWASYMATQVARLDDREDFPKDRNRKELLLNAERYFQQAEKNVPKGDPLAESSVEFMKGFLYLTFMPSITEDEKEIEKYKQLGRIGYRKSMQIMPENPQMMVMSAIWIGTGEDVKSYQITGSLNLFDRARAVMESAENRGLTPYVNHDFIGFWRARVESQLNAKLEEEIAEYEKSE